MYELNTRKGKIDRMKTLQKLVEKISNRELDLDDERKIIEYLKDIKSDLHTQLVGERNDLIREFHTNQAKIDRGRKITRQERAELIKRNRKIIEVLAETKELVV